MALTHGDVLRVTMNFLLQAGVQYQNVYTYLYDGVGFPTDAAVLEDLEDHMALAYDELVGLIDPTITEDLCSVDIIEFIAGEWAVTRNVGTFTITWAPVGTGGILPYQSSAFVTFKTARPKSVGRKFLFPLTEPQQVATILDAGAVTAIVAYAALILADITVDLINLLHPCIARTGVDDILVFTAAVVTNVLGSQKRRRPGDGA